MITYTSCQKKIQTHWKCKIWYLKIFKHFAQICKIKHWAGNLNMIIRTCMSVLQCPDQVFYLKSFHLKKYAPIKFSNFFNLKNWNGNFIFVFGCKIQLARFVSVLHARIVCLFAHFLRCCLLLFFTIVFLWDLGFCSVLIILLLMLQSTN